MTGAEPGPAGPLFLRGLGGPSPPGDPAGQAALALREAEARLRAAGADIRRLEIALTDRVFLAPVEEALSRLPGAAAAPRAVTILPGLAEPGMLVEIGLDAAPPCPAAQAELRLPGLSAPAPRGHTAEAAALQAEAVFDALEARLEAAGARLGDLCKITMQITDRAFRQPVYGVMGRRLAGVRPVSTGLIVAGLPDPHALFQLDAVVIPGGPHARIRPYLSTSMPYGRERQPFQAEFCMAVRAGRDILLRGQTGLSLAGVFHGEGDPAAQARQAMDNVERLLAEAGAGLGDVAHAALYVTDRAFLAPARAVVRERLGAAPPLAQRIVRGLAAPELLMEVDVRARLP